MREIKEFFDEIARFESSIMGNTEIIDINSLRIRCKKIAFYDHPLAIELNCSIIEDRDMFFLFRGVIFSKKLLHPYLQKKLFAPAIWLPEVEIEDISLQKNINVTLNTYDLSELNYYSPNSEIISASVIKWSIVAESFSLFVDA